MTAETCETWTRNSQYYNDNFFFVTLILRKIHTKFRKNRKSLFTCKNMEIDKKIY